jgi:cysteine desulfuration protein SufE
MTTLPTLDAIRADFALLDDWEDRYRYVIELGRMLDPLDETLRNDGNKVRGCASQVWIACRRDGQGGDAVLTFAGDSDAHIVRGLIAILLSLYSGQRARDILAIDVHAVLAELGLSEHLTPQRSNGLKSMVERIRADAQAASAL